MPVPRSRRAGPLAAEAARGLEGAGLEVGPIWIRHRADFVHAMTAGAGVVELAPTGKVAGEIGALYEWTLDTARRLAEETA